MVADNSVRVVILILLAVDGVLCAVAAALLLPYRIGGVPMPISAVFAGLINLGLVWAASYWARSGSLAALPLWTWLATVAAFTLGGPGGDVIVGGEGVRAFSVLILLTLGCLPPVLMLRRIA